METDTLLHTIKARIAGGLCDLRVVGEQFTGKWDQDIPAALLAELSSLRTRLAESEAREKRLSDLINRNWVGRYWRAVNDEQAEEIRAALAEGGAK